MGNKGGREGKVMEVRGVYGVCLYYAMHVALCSCLDSHFVIATFYYIFFKTHCGYCEGRES